MSDFSIHHISTWPGSNHFTTGLDSDGEEVMVGISSYDWWVMETLDDGVVYGLYPNTPEANTYTSTHSSSSRWTHYGWDFLEAYGTTGYALTDSIFALEMNKSKSPWKILLNGTVNAGGQTGSFSTSNRVRIQPAASDPTQMNRIWRIATRHSNDQINQQSRANITMSGNYIYYTCTWEASGGTAAALQPDVYQITLPPTWYQDLSSAIIDTTPPAAPTGVTVN
jgi:hypothetical protein